jgi:hypothetical protein
VVPGEAAYSLNVSESLPLRVASQTLKSLAGRTTISNWRAGIMRGTLNSAVRMTVSWENIDQASGHVPPWLC